MPSLPRAKTKIISTLGPASQTETVLRKMMLAGLDVARFNFSHGTHQEHQRRLDVVRLLNKKYRRRIKILQDLEGHRIRIGRLKSNNPLPLHKRQILFLSKDPSPKKWNKIPFDYEGSLDVFKKGCLIHIDDGRIVLEVISRSKDVLKTKVVTPGLLKPNKGVNIPEVKLSFKGLPEKDKTDLQFGIQNNVDFVAQSFVRNKRDIQVLRDHLSGKLPSCKIIAKIENKEGIQNIDDILDASDGIIVARGDLGVSLPIYQIPIVQKKLIQKCLRRKKMVITATQMLESILLGF